MYIVYIYMYIYILLRNNRLDYLLTLKLKHYDPQLNRQSGLFQRLIFQMNSAIY